MIPDRNPKRLRDKKKRKLARARRGFLRSWQEIADYMGVSHKGLRILVAQGLPVRKISNYYLSHAELVDDWLKEFILQGTPKNMPAGKRPRGIPFTSDL